MTDAVEGLWRLVESRAWDEHGHPVAAPYGEHPIGHIAFANGRMLAALCNGDDEVGPGQGRGYSSYGGPYRFDGTTLEVAVDMASDPARIGGRQVRGVVMQGGDRMLLLPPPRLYGGSKQRRELVWQCVWRPGDEGDGTPR
jgi:hypothetical protein